MFVAIHQFLHELQWLVLLITLPTGTFYAWKFYNALTTPVKKPVTTRRAAAQPVKPGGVQQNLLEKSAASSSKVGEDSRKAKAQEPTIRIGTDDQRVATKPHSTTELLGKKSADDDDDEVGQLFAGLDDQLTPKSKLPPAEPKDVLTRASRMAELGFHHSIPSDVVRPTDAPTDSGDHDRIATARDASQGATEAAAQKPTTAPDATDSDDDSPQLDDILARLDRVLGDEPDAPAAAPATTVSTSSEAQKPADAPADKAKPATETVSNPPAATTPAWARADITDDDIDDDKSKGSSSDSGRQLGLFDGGDDKKTDKK